MRINDYLIEKARNVDFREILEKRYEIKADKKILCPFHPETAPSCGIDYEQKVWHCFGCNKGGDIITFVMEMEKCTFEEAVLTLVGKMGDNPLHTVLSKIQQLKVPPTPSIHEVKVLYEKVNSEISKMLAKWRSELRKKVGEEKFIEWEKDPNKKLTDKEYLDWKAKISYAEQRWNKILDNYAIRIRASIKCAQLGDKVDLEKVKTGILKMLTEIKKLLIELKIT
jgi:hypothetical protein